VQVQTIDLPPMDFRADVSSVNVEARTVEVIWTTGADVERFDWLTGTSFYERLSLEAESVDMRRLQSGTAPVLDTHSAYSVANIIGVVQSASLEPNRRGLANLRFPKAEDDPETDRVFRKMADRIIRNVSFGYKVRKYEVVGQKEGVDIRMAKRWMPFEISMVPMGADMNARTRGVRPFELNPCLVVNRVHEDADRLRRFRFARARAF
jgi:HK97 family phage prohead protease